MALNSAGLALAATAIQSGLLYAQLHSAAAGVSGTDNVASIRALAHWGVPSGGDFGLSSALRFTGGASNGPVYSVTMWDTDTVGTGTFYGEYVLTGDLTFNGQGEFQVTAIDFTGTATDA